MHRRRQVKNIGEGQGLDDLIIGKGHGGGGGGANI